MDDAAAGSIDGTSCNLSSVTRLKYVLGLTLIFSSSSCEGDAYCYAIPVIGWNQAYIMWPWKLLKSVLPESDGFDVVEGGDRGSDPIPI